MRLNTLVLNSIACTICWRNTANLDHASKGHQRDASLPNINVAQAIIVSVCSPLASHNGSTWRLQRRKASKS